MSMTWDDYRSLQAVNWSSLKHMLRSPAHYLHELHHPSPDTPGRAMGRAVHALVLEGVRGYEVYDGDRRGRAWTEFRDQHAGRTILKATEAAAVEAMAAAVLAHPEAVRVLGGQREVSLTWQRAGHTCKGRLDCLTPQWVTDLKTAGPLDVFARTAWSSGYIHQLAWYRRGGLVEDAYLVAVEAKAPHDVGVWAIDRAAMDLADREIDGLLERLTECQASGVWLGRFPAVETLGAPAWLAPEDMIEMPEGGEDEFGF